jgi:hypothetical protein
LESHAFTEYADYEFAKFWNYSFLEYYEHKNPFVGKGEGCNADRTIGTTHLLHNDRLLSAITATWPSHLEPQQRILTLGQNKDKIPTHLFYVRTRQKYPASHTMGTGSLSLG